MNLGREEFPCLISIRNSCVLNSVCVCEFSYSFIDFIFDELCQTDNGSVIETPRSIQNDGIDISLDATNKSNNDDCWIIDKIVKMFENLGTA